MFRQKLSWLSSVGVRCRCDQLRLGFNHARSFAAQPSSFESSLSQESTGQAPPSVENTFSLPPSYLVSKKEAGVRLDRFVREKRRWVPESELNRMIKQNEVRFAHTHTRTHTLFYAAPF